MSERASRGAPEVGRLGARPTAERTDGAVQTGLQPLGIGGKRDGLVCVPAGYIAEKPAGLALMLHGAGGSAPHATSLLQSSADEANLIVVGPESRASTWDVLVGEYGPDVEMIDRALEQTFARYEVDPARVAIGGFSDGASYALSLGIMNGDLFTHIIAFSPGFMAPLRAVGEPKVYITHGTEDSVLPINRCSRRIVPALRRSGYEVTYREFEGPHVVPPELAREAVGWMNSARLG